MALQPGRAPLPGESGRDRTSQGKTPPQRRVPGARGGLAPAGGPAYPAAMRRTPFNRGAWAVQRERCHLAAAAPLAPAVAVTVAEVAEQLLKKWGLEARAWEERLLRDWAVVVGAAVAAHTRPGRMDRGTLVIFVDTSVWLSELARLSRGPLLANVQRHTGADKVRNLRLQLDPDPPRARPS